MYSLMAQSNFDYIWRNDRHCESVKQVFYYFYISLIFNFDYSLNSFEVSELLVNTYQNYQNFSPTFILNVSVVDDH